MELFSPSHTDNRSLDAGLLAIVILLVVTSLCAVSALIWRNDFVGGVYRFFILFKASQTCSATYLIASSNMFRRRGLLGLEVASMA